MKNYMIPTIRGHIIALLFVLAIFLMGAYLDAGAL